MAQGNRPNIITDPIILLKKSHLRLKRNLLNEPPPRANDGADVSPVLDLVNALIADKKPSQKVNQTCDRV